MKHWRQHFGNSSKAPSAPGGCIRGLASNASGHESLQRASHVEQRLGLVAGDERDGPWVYELPAEFVAALAELSADGILDLAPQCGDQPDLVGLDREVFEPLLTALAELARHARAKRQLVLAKLSL